MTTPASPSLLNWRQSVTLTLLFGILLFLPLLFGRELESGDETRVAGIAAEMVLTGDWMVPHLNGTLFLEYPPLFYWCAGGIFNVFGITDAAARFVPMLFALGSMLCVLQLARKMRFSPGAALLAAIILATSAQYFGNARKCTVDVALAFFVLLTVTAFVSYLRSFSLKAKLFYFVLTAIGFAGGILTKGILGAGIPAVILGGTRVLNDLFVFRKVNWKRDLALAAAFALGVGAASLYYLQFYRNPAPESQAVFHELFYVNNFGRFSGSQGDHVENVFYYFAKLPTLFEPYLLFVLIGLYGAIRNFRHRRETFLAAALLLPFVLFCAASSKRIVYLLPLAPFAALLAVWCFCCPLRNFRVKKFHFRRLTEWFTVRRTVLTVVVLALLVAGGNCLVNCIAPDESQAELFARCRELEKQGFVVELAGAQERTRGGAVFYLEHTVPVVSADSPQPANRVRIYRSRKEIPGAEAFPDSHWLLLGNKSFENIEEKLE